MTSKQRRPDPREYTAISHWVVEDEGPSYYIAYSPEFGFCACSGPGDTEEEAIKNLRINLAAMMDYYEETGRPIPEPMYLDFETGKTKIGKRPKLAKREKTNNIK